MPGVVKLTPPPTAAQEVRASVVEVLKEVLAQAEAGEVIDVQIIVGHPDGSWTDRTSQCLQISSVIGRLEILKHNIILNHLRPRE